MKKITASVIVMNLLFGIYSAQAANSAGGFDLKVTGRITPASCSITLANSGNIDYGDIALSTMTGPDGATTGDGFLLEDKVLKNAITVTCDGSTFISINTIDNRASSVGPVYSSVHFFNADGSVSRNTSHPSEILGLGFTDENIYIGGYSASFTGLSVDGNTDVKFSDCVAEDNLVSSAKVSDQGAMRVITCPAGQSHQVVDATSDDAMSGKIFVWDYRTSAAIAEDASSKAFDMDGSVTVQINYL